MLIEANTETYTVGVAPSRAKDLFKQALCSATLNFDNYSVCQWNTDIADDYGQTFCGRLSLIPLKHDVTTLYTLHIAMIDQVRTTVFKTRLLAHEGIDSALTSAVARRTDSLIRSSIGK